jgi:hypothetical protein
MIMSKPISGVPRSRPLLARAGQFVFREFQPVKPHGEPFIASLAIAILKWLMLFAISFGASTVLHAQSRPDTAGLSQSPISATQQAVLPLASQEQPTSSQAPSAGKALLLGAGDLLDVRVFDTPELSGKFRVDMLVNPTEGRNLPLAGAGPPSWRAPVIRFGC